MTALNLVDSLLDQLNDSHVESSKSSTTTWKNSTIPSHLTETYSNYSKNDSSNVQPLSKNEFFKYNYPSTTDNFPKLTNTSVIDAALGKIPSRIPIWLHRQAGRYMSEFRAIREKYDFFTICKTPQLTCEVTLQPINKFTDKTSGICKLDGAIIFSDILVLPPIILNRPVTMVQGIGPVFNHPLRYETENENENKDDSENENGDEDANMSIEERLVEYSKRLDNITSTLDYVYKGITLTRHALEGRVPLIGFTGGPWTLFAYMVEGKSSKTWTKSKETLIKYNKFSVKMLDILSKAIVIHLVNQVKAGAQMLEVFESNAGALAPDMFEQFVIPQLKYIYTQLTNKIKELKLDVQIPLILFAREAHDCFEELVDIGFDVLAVDWGRKQEKVREISKSKVTLQGNFDPWKLFGNEQFIKENVYKMLDGFQIQKYQKKRLIVNLGHGMLPNHDPQCVEYLIQAVRDYEMQYFK